MAQFPNVGNFIFLDCIKSILLFGAKPTWGILVSWPENQGILFFYISKTLEMIRISFMASLLNAVL